MKTVSKHDRLRMLARIACELAWTQDAGLIAERLTKLRRFVDRNVENCEMPNYLTYDDIGNFDLQQMKVHREAPTTADLTVNDQHYLVTFDVVGSADDGCEVKNVEVWPIKDYAPGDDKITDALLLEFVEARLDVYVQDHETEYLKGLADASEARRLEQQIDKSKGDT